MYYILKVGAGHQTLAINKGCCCLSAGLLDVCVAGPRPVATVSLTRSLSTPLRANQGAVQLYGGSVSMTLKSRLQEAGEALPHLHGFQRDFVSPMFNLPPCLIAWITAGNHTGHR